MRAELLLATLAVAAGAAWAHGEDHLPAGPGWRLEAAAALVAADADGRWPAADPRGVLVTGAAEPDRSGGLRLEHGLLAAAWRFGALTLPGGLESEGPALRLVLGFHDRDDAHVEAAGLWLPLDGPAGHLVLALGREPVPMGEAVDRAGHLDTYGQPTLAQRAVLGDAWIADGLRLRWDTDQRRGLRTLQAGLWQARAFPGGAAGPAAPSLHTQLGWDDWALDLAAARLEPEARGAAARSRGATGHVHGSLDCRRSLQQRVCFDGRSTLAAASLAWAPAGRPWQATAAALRRDEQGTLYSSGAAGRLAQRVDGAWLDLRWRPAPAWQLGWRGERLLPRVRLEGTGLAALAAEAGLADAAPTTRHTLALEHMLRPGWRLALEAGRQRAAAAGASAAQTVDHVALRLVVDGMVLEGATP